VTSSGPGAPFTHLAHVLDPVCAIAPDRPALIVGAEVTTYAGLRDAAARAAGALHASGLRPRGRVLLAASAGPLAMATVLGAAYAGGSAALVNPRLTAGEIGDLLRVLGGADVAVADDDVRDTVAAAGVTTLGPKDLDAAEPVTGDPVGDADDDAVVLFTSGTTGLPKAVPHSHAAFTARVKAFAQPAVADHQVRLLCVPIFHVGGLLGQCVSLYAGHTTVVQQRFDAGEWLRLVAEHRVQVTFLVPTMLARILDHPDFERTDTSSLTSITYGAAPMPVTVIERAAEAMPHVALTNTFGQTETLGGIAFLSAEDHHHPVRRASVGKLLPSVVSRIVGDDGSDDDEGELWIGRPDGSWLHTGDLVRRDADGYLYVSGRLSDTINRGGEKFGPVEVEAAIRAHPGVTDAAVIPLRHNDLGEVAGAVVAGDVTPQDIAAWCRGRLAAYKVPARVVVVDDVPYTDLGKPDRRAITALLEA
jgi:long-chain acyl-CoA synthetase